MKDLMLNNGQAATFLYEDDWSRPVYQLESGTKVCCINLDGTYLHTMSGDFGEPDCPLKDEYQPRVTMQKAFDIPGIHESIKKNYDAGLISLEEAAKEFFKNNWTSTIDIKYTKEKLGIV